MIRSCFRALLSFLLLLCFLSPCSADPLPDRGSLTPEQGMELQAEVGRRAHHPRRTHSGRIPRRACAERFAHSAFRTRRPPVGDPRRAGAHRLPFRPTGQTCQRYPHRKRAPCGTALVSFRLRRLRVGKGAFPQLISAMQKTVFEVPAPVPPAYASMHLIVL